MSPSQSAYSIPNLRRRGFRPRPWVWFAGCSLVLALLSAVRAADPVPAAVPASVPAATATPTPAPTRVPIPATGPQVVRVSDPIRLGGQVRIQLEGLRAWAESGGAPHKLLLHLDGRASPGDLPESVDLDRGELIYHLMITPENRDVWDDILRQPKQLSRKIHVSVGPGPDSHFVAVRPEENVVNLQVVPWPWGLVSLIVLGLTLAGLVYMARHTDLIRDSGPASTPGRPKPYSLSRTQMAVWFYLVFAAYLVIWLVTGDLNTITESLLGLMGISAGTALGGAVIDNQKRDGAASQLAKLGTSLAAPAPGDPALPAATPPSVPTPASSDVVRSLAEKMDPGVSEGFLRDILSDGQGFSLHRFQIAAWTVALGVIFVADTYNTLLMPEFSATLLGLMGISAGTYLGFKVPET